MTHLKQPFEPSAVMPILPRAGLGNMLLPWARAVALSTQLGIPLLSPSWFKLRLGPYARHETDYRLYQNLFKPVRLTARARAVVGRSTSPLLDEQLNLLREGVGKQIVVVEGLADYFTQLYSTRYRIAQKFKETLRSDIVSRSYRPGPYVALHVRLGDFRAASRDQPAQGNQSTPIRWFRRRAEEIRRLAPDVPILLCSDGTDDELASLLDIPLLSRSGGRNAAEDLLILSQAKLIFGSTSTFSAWGCFLTGTPLIVDSGQNLYLQTDPLVSELSYDDSLSVEQFQVTGLLSTAVDGRSTGQYGVSSVLTDTSLEVDVREDWPTKLNIAT